MHHPKQSAKDYKVSSDELVDFASSIEIPSCPRVLVELSNVQKQGFPDPRVIAKLAEQDPAITAALLKTVNSPYFGLRTKILSVQQAVIFLGMNNVMSIVTAIALKSASAGIQGEGVARFWDHISITATFAADLANRIIGMARDEVFIHVLFRDAAIPLIIAQRVKRGQISDLVQRDLTAYMAQVATEQRSMDHAIIGHHFTKKWLMPERTQQSVRLHLNIEIFLGGQQKEETGKWVSLQIAIGYLAEHIMREHYSIPHDELWESTQLDAFLRYVNISRADFVKVTGEILDEQKNKNMVEDMFMM